MKPPRNLWPYGIITTFALFFCGTIGLVVLASRQHVELVNANYYEQEIKYQSRIDDASREQQLNGTASITYDSVLKRIVVTLPEVHTSNGVSGQVELYRPSTAGLDRQFALHLTHNNIQS